MDTFGNFELSPGYLPGTLDSLSHVFNAPRSLVFGAWIDQEQLAKWWGPMGFSNPVCKIDVRPGGKIYIEMKSPEGTVYPMAGAFKAISEPERIVFTSSALDNEGKPALEVENAVMFAENAGRTTLSVRARVLNATSLGRTYLQGMQEGWSQSFERLAALLKGG